MNFSNRIKELRQKKKITQEELAKAIGVSRSTIAGYESKNREPDFETLTKLSHYFNVSTDYLLGKSDEHNIDFVQNFLKNNPNVKPVGKMIPIPIIGTVKAGFNGSLAYEEYLGSELIEMDAVKDGDYFFLRVKGDSMYPEIFEGDLVLVRKQPDVESGELAVVIVNGDEGVVKKVIKKENAIVLQSLNPKYEPIVITEGQDFMIVGKVKRVVRIY